jgi:hypothetical protein
VEESVQSAYPAVEERLGSLIIEGQRREVWIRSRPDPEGTWHNAILFRRDGKLSAPEAVVAAVDWQVPPGVAIQKARRLPERDQLQLFRQAHRPRSSLF